MSLKDKILILAFGTLAVVVVGLAVTGAFLSYSPVPIEDMWDGYVGFLMKVSDGQIGIWWDNHNEHRIILSRALFWADQKWFGGAGWFLIVTNYFLVSATALVFWRILCDSVALEKPTTAEILLGLFVTAWLFQWMQFENLTRGFQSQFILAQLLPLCGFYWLHKSIAERNTKHNFFVACGFGVASVGAMANGILSLPLMALYAILTRQSLTRTGLLASLSVAMLFLYFHNYTAPSQHGSLTQTLRDNPSGFIRYILIYLGSPFYYLYAGNLNQPIVEFGKLIAQAAGLALIGNSAWLAIKALRNPSEMTLELAMLFFILYIGGTAFGTAGGRLVFGLDQALSSRYTTPALMAWSALLIVYSPAILATIRTSGSKSLPVFAVLSILMINLQCQSLQPQNDELFEREIAALALAIHINDQTQIKRIYPAVEPLLAGVEKAAEKNLSIFGMYPFNAARQQFGNTAPALELPPCKGYIDNVDLVNGDDRFIRVNGWIFNPLGKSCPQIVNFINAQSQIVGYAITGMPRQDVADAVDKNALLSGYKGYILSDQMGLTMTLQAENQSSPSCQMQAKVPLALFSLTPTKPSSEPIGASGLPLR
jgi:hypothetical protein